MRVAAIVDSRNIRGLAGSLLGQTRSPTVEGLEACLAPLGFDIDSAFFSVAIPRERDRARLSRELGENERYIDRLTRDARAQILRGELHVLSDGRIEEKLVDVLCAVETVRQAKRIGEAPKPSDAEAVLLFSQDADLGPGIHLAQEFGVPVLTVAPGRVHNRGHPFIVLAEPALAALCGVDEPFGQEVRRSVAEAAVNPAIDSWEYRYERTRKGTRVARFVHRHGLHGEADPSLAGTAATGNLFDLGPIGVVPDQGNEFPVLRLDIDPADGDDLVSGVVVGRFQPFRVTVDVNKGRQVKVYAPNSYLTPGTRVLLQGDDPDRLRYVGSLQEPLPLVGSGGVEMAAISVIATVSNHRKGHAYGVTVEDSVEVFIPSGADPTEVGGRYLVSLVGSGRDPHSPFVAHLASTRLPT